MGTVTVSLPSDGDTIDAADYNTPINTIVDEINGSLDNSNLASDAAIAGSKIADGAITNAKLSTTTGELGGAWQSWTPSFTNFTLGNGSVTAKYFKVGKFVKYNVTIILGSTSSVSSGMTMSLPVTSISYATTFPIGRGVYLDNGTATYQALNRVDDTNNITFFYWAGAGTGSGVSNTGPFTWTTNDAMYLQGEYEAA